MYPYGHDPEEMPLFNGGRSPLDPSSIARQFGEELISMRGQPGKGSSFYGGLQNAPNSYGMHELQDMLLSKNLVPGMQGNAAQRFAAGLPGTRVVNVPAWMQQMPLSSLHAHAHSGMGTGGGMNLNQYSGMNGIGTGPRANLVSMVNNPRNVEGGGLGVHPSQEGTAGREGGQGVPVGAAGGAAMQSRVGQLGMGESMMGMGNPLRMGVGQATSNLPMQGPDKAFAAAGFQQEMSNRSAYMLFGRSTGQGAAVQTGMGTTTHAHVAQAQDLAQAHGAQLLAQAQAQAVQVQAQAQAQMWAHHMKVQAQAQAHNQVLAQAKAAQAQVQADQAQVDQVQADQVQADQAQAQAVIIPRSDKEEEGVLEPRQ